MKDITYWGFLVKQKQPKKKTLEINSLLKKESEPFIINSQKENI
jgi:hypothetical protein